MGPGRGRFKGSEVRKKRPGKKFPRAGWIVNDER